MEERYAMQRMRFGVLLAAALTLTSPTLAVELTLEQAIDLALTDGYRARSLKLQLQQAEEDRAAADGRTATQVDLVLDSPNFAKQVQSVRIPNQLPAYNTIGSTQWRGQLQVRKPIAATNTTVSVTTDFQQRKESVFADQASQTNERKEFQSQVRVSLQQPLFTPNTMKLNLERADLQLERTQRQFTEAQLDVAYTVSQAFYQLASAARQHDIAAEDVARQEQAYEIAETRFNVGAIIEMELIQIEADLAQSRNALIAARGTLERAADNFKATVGLDLSADVRPRPEVQIRAFAIDSTLALEHAMRHRSDVRGREIDRRLAEITLRETDARSTVTGNLTAYYDRTGVSDPFLPSDTGTPDLFESSWDDLRRRPQNLGVRFTVTVPIWDGRTNTSEVAAARLALAQRDLDSADQEVQLAREVRAAISRVREARDRLTVLEKGLEVARRGYEMSVARFGLGAITALDLSNSHGQLTRAQLNQLDAFVQYRLAVADLARQTLYDFERGESLVAE